jgi:hypothetical protein
MKPPPDGGAFSAPPAGVDPSLLQGWHGFSRPYRPYSVRACEEELWTLAMVNTTTGETALQPFRCRSWRCKRCAPYVNRLEHDRIEEGMENADTDALAFLTLTFDRKRYTKPRDAWYGATACWKKLRDRLAYHYGTRGRGGKRARVRYVSVFEQHQNGWPHVHALVECRELLEDMTELGFYEREQDGKERKIYRWTRKVLRPMLLDSGFGPIAHTEPPDSIGGMAGYLVKLAAELTGSHSKQDQTPVRAPKGFRRLRATPGFLPSRKREATWTGRLVHARTETLEMAADCGKFNWIQPKENDGKDGSMSGMWRPLRSERDQAAQESSTRCPVSRRGVLFLEQDAPFDSRPDWK